MNQHNPYQPPAAAGFGPQSAIPTGVTGQYEFNQFENQTIMKLGTRIKWWGALSMIFGALACLGILGMGLTVGAALAHAEGAIGLMVMGGTIAVAIPIVLVYLVTGGLYVGSGNAFKEVVRTQGNDIAHILAAIEKMGKAFFIEIVVTVIGFGLGIIGVIALFAFGAATGNL